MKKPIYIAAVLAVIVLIAGNAIADEKKLKAVGLSKPQMDTGAPLMKALKERKTTRSFDSKKLPPQVLSNLLWAAFGVNRLESGKRTAPSAMNRQEIVIYVALPEGVYLYNAREQRLDPVLAKDIRQYTGEQTFTQSAPVNLIYVADYSKMGKAGTADKDFYSAADTGFISQNVYLYCASEGLATVVLGWVNKPALAKIMKLRPDQKIILTQPVGYPKK
jgi:SagB-type dehydrogenase family enzyme